jgi:tRNA nucleotidyltransferase (CCA-adding enzyme)
MNAMVIRRTSYPQVEARAADLVTAAVAVVPRTLTVGAAARVLARRRAGLVAATVGPGWASASAAVLARAVDLGLEGARLDAVLWDAPAVGPKAPEVSVRRTLDPATPAVLVIEGGAPVGAVTRDAAPLPLPRSVAAALDRLPPEVGRVLVQAGAVGQGLGWPVALVGGVPRDLLSGRRAGVVRDLDLAVEGDGRELARALASTTGGAMREHPAFGTATVTLPDGMRVDVATARRERYPRAGALPVVEPATLAEDLSRRDFSINALGVRLDGAARGRLLDPAGGLADLERRRVRVLHPLSFVEDPTRIFRAARFATRLGFRLNRTTRRLLGAAAGLDAYGALSADRLRAELEAILGEASPAAVLTWLGKAGAFRLVRRGVRVTPAAAARLRRVETAVRELGLAEDAPASLYLLAVGADLAPAELDAWLAGWAVPLRQRGAVARARDGAAEILRELERWVHLVPAERDSLSRVPGLSRAPELTAAWAWVVAPRPALRKFLGHYRRRVRGLRPHLTGDDLSALGLAPGPLFARVLEAARLAQVEGRLTSRDEALGWVRELLRRPIDVNRPDPQRKGG